MTSMTQCSKDFKLVQVPLFYDSYSLVLDFSFSIFSYFHSDEKCKYAAQENNTTASFRTAVVSPDFR